MKSFLKKHLILFIVLAIILISFTACTPTFTGKPEPVTDEDTILEQSIVDTTQDIINKCNIANTTICRNKIIYSKMIGIDIKYFEFQTQLVNSYRELTFGTAITTIGLNAAEVYTGYPLLSVLSTAIIGSKAAYDSNILMDKAISGIQTEMISQRNIVKIRLIQGMQQDVNTYPLELALIDLTDYYNAGTLIAAYNGLSESASNKSTEVNKKLSQVITAKYTNTKSSDIIHNYILDKDNNPIIANIHTLDNWLKGKGIPEHSSMFMNDSNPDIELKRQEAITELNINN